MSAELVQMSPCASRVHVRAGHSASILNSVGLQRLAAIPQFTVPYVAFHAGQLHQIPSKSALALAAGSQAIPPQQLSDRAALLYNTIDVTGRD
jgi:hypothetical protein